MLVIDLAGDARVGTHEEFSISVGVEAVRRGVGLRTDGTTSRADPHVRRWMVVVFFH